MASAATVRGREGVLDRPPAEQLPSDKTLDASSLDEATDSSYYTLASDSGDVDRWLHPASPVRYAGSADGSAGSGATDTAAVQYSRVGVAQHSTLTAAAPGPSAGLWCALAMLLPYLSVSSGPWRCTPAYIFSLTELAAHCFAGFLARARVALRSLAGEHMARDLFAVGMDVVLVIYALGFLALSVYQSMLI